MSDESAQRQARRGDSQSVGWSLQLGQVLGIPIRVHFTFVLLLGYFASVAASQNQSVPGWILFLVLVFACIALHELGHALMARAFGVRTREIVLYPFGGIARLENLPAGLGELLIALAGPGVNVLLAVGMVIGLIALRLPFLPQQAGAILSLRDVAPNLVLSNVILVAFNLIPAFPMDGGRVLRALLSLAMPEERATGLAALVGQGIAVLLGAAGLWFWNPMLLFIALFVFLGAGHEAAFSRRRAAVVGHVAREAMVVRFETLAPHDSLDHAAQRLLSTHQQDFPVLDAWNRVVGILTRATLLHGLARQGNAAAVLEVMQREFPTVGPDTNLEDVLRTLQSSPGIPVLVVDEGGLRGMITLENLAEFIEVARRTAPVTR